MVKSHKRWALCALLFWATRAGAADIQWNNAAAGSLWQDGGNWLPSGAPVDADSAYLLPFDASNRVITLDSSVFGGTLGNLALAALTLNATGSGGLTLDQIGGNLTVSGSEIIGQNGHAFFLQQSGTHSIGSGGSLQIAYLPGSTATYSLTGSGVLTVTGAETIGYLGAGHFIQDGGTHIVTGAGGLVVGGPGAGIYSLSGGVLSVQSANEIVGQATGTAGSTFLQTGGTHEVTGAGENLSISGTNGLYSLSNGVLTVPNLFVGGSAVLASGLGRLTVSGGTLNVAGTLKVWNGGTGGNGSTLAFSGGVINVGTLGVGQSQTTFSWTGGTLNFTDTTTALNAQILFAPSASTFTLQSTQTLHALGDENFISIQPPLLVQNGGVHSVDGTFTIGGARYTLAGGLLHANVLSLQPGAALTLSGGTLDYATFVLAAGSVVGAVVNTSTLVAAGGSVTGNVTNSGTLQVPSSGGLLYSGTLVQQAGTLDASYQNLTISNFNYTGGAVLGTLDFSKGTLTIGPGTGALAINVTTTNSHQLVGDLLANQSIYFPPATFVPSLIVPGSFTNSGTLVFSNFGTSNSYMSPASQFINSASGVIRIGLDSPNSSQLISATPTLSNSGQIVAGPSVSVKYAGVLIQQAGTIDVSAGATWLQSGGTFNMLGGTVLGTLSVSGKLNYAGGTLTGPVLLSGGTLSVAGGLPAPAFSVPSSGTLLSDWPAGQTISVSSGASLSILGNLTNAGVINLLGGTASISVNLLHFESNGATLFNSGTLHLGNGFAGNVTFSFVNAAVISNTGLVWADQSMVSQSPAVINSGVFRLSPQVTYQQSNTFTQQAGTLDVSADQAAFGLGTFQFNGGTILGTVSCTALTISPGAGPGAFVMPTSGTLAGNLQTGETLTVGTPNASFSTTLSVSDNFSNSGTILFSLPLLSANVGTLHFNSIGKTFTNTVGGLVQPGLGSPSIVGTASFIDSAAIANAGTMVVNHYSWSYAGTLTNTGVFQVAPAFSFLTNGRFVQQDGTLNIPPGATFSQTFGTFSFTGGSIAGTVTLGNAATLDLEPSSGAGTFSTSGTGCTLLGAIHAGQTVVCLASGTGSTPIIKYNGNLINSGDLVLTQSLVFSSVPILAFNSANSTFTNTPSGVVSIIALGLASTQTLTNCSVFINQGVVHVGESFSHTGTFINSGFVDSGGTFSSYSGGTVSNNGTFALGGGMNVSLLSNSGTFQIRGGVNAATMAQSAGLSSVGAATVGSLILSGGSMIAAAGSKSLLNITSLSLNAATIDLTTNSMLVHSSTPSAIHTMAAGGLLLSSTAEPFLSDAGILTGDEFHALYGASAKFLGATVVSTDTLLTFTLRGDADLDGKITLADFALIDASFFFNHASPGSAPDWMMGDFNYDGVVNYQDYALIDASFSRQSAGPLAQEMIADHTGQFGAQYVAALAQIQSSVPEPGSVLLLIGAIGGRSCLRRRRCVRTAQG